MPFCPTRDIKTAEVEGQVFPLLIVYHNCPLMYTHNWQWLAVGISLQTLSVISLKGAGLRDWVRVCTSKHGV